MDIGIAIIMAVSLNIVNGMTGQFSIGHAGFMTLGGYLAAFITYYGSHVHLGRRQNTWWIFWEAVNGLFVSSCIMGGLLAAGAGYVVGLPSLRLRGDYLAIVTLGFGEIIRVILQQTGRVISKVDALKAGGLSQMIPPPVGGALGVWRCAQIHESVLGLHDSYDHDCRGLSPEKFQSGPFDDFDP